MEIDWNAGEIQSGLAIAPNVNAAGCQGILMTYPQRVTYPQPQFQNGLTAINPSDLSQSKTLIIHDGSVYTSFYRTEYSPISPLTGIIDRNN